MGSWIALAVDECWLMLRVCSRAAILLQTSGALWMNYCNDRGACLVHVQKIMGVDSTKKSQKDISLD